MTVRRIYNNEGFCTSIPKTANATGFYYCIKDINGNIAMVRYSGTTMQQVKYFPDGTPYMFGGSIPSIQERLFSGKELDIAHGYECYDFGARHYKYRKESNNI